MELLQRILDSLFPDVIIYGMVVLVFVVGIFKCVRPVLRNASILRRASDLLREGAKAKLARPVWGDVNFLGKRLQPVWRGFLHTAEVGATSGIAPDIADYVHDDSVITEPGKASLADIIPGTLTSFGILGTFIGLSMGLTGLDVMEINSYVQLTGGIAFAFNTSIVGIIASLIFNFINRYAIGKARSAIDSFVNTFYVYGISQPADPLTQILAQEQEQSAAMGRFADDMSGRMAGEIHRAIASAMSPVQRTMDEFINAATRAQVEGLDYIVARFVDRMNKVLNGQLKQLGDALSETANGQLHTQERLHGIVNSIGDLTQRVVEVNGISEQVIERFTAYVGDMGTAYQQVGQSQAQTGETLANINDAAERQAKYLSALQEYQAQLQASFRDYTVWTDKFVEGLQTRTGDQNAALEQTAMEMRASSELLSGSYQGFTESIQEGLANALQLFDDNMRTLMQQVQDTLGEVRQTMAQLEESVRKASDKVDVQ